MSRIFSLVRSERSVTLLMLFRAAYSSEEGYVIDVIDGGKRCWLGPMYPYFLGHTGPRLTVLRNLGLQPLGPQDIWTGDIRSRELRPNVWERCVKLSELGNLTRKDWIGHL